MIPVPSNSIVTVAAWAPTPSFSMDLQWQRPEALALFPLLALATWLAGRRRPVRTVASTAPWSALSGSQRIRFPWLLMAALMAASLAAAQPAWIPVPNPLSVTDDRAQILSPQRGSAQTQLEVIVAPGAGAVDVGLHYPDRDPESISIERDPHVPRSWARTLPLTPDGDDRDRSSRRVHIELPSGRWSLPIPTPPSPVRVDNRSESKAVARALHALRDSGWITLNDPAPHDLVVRAAGTQKPSDTTVNREGVTVWVASSATPTTDFLPRLKVSALSHPIARGLAFESWPILERRSIRSTEVQTEIILDSSAGPIIEANDREVWLHFDPDQDSLADDPRWAIFWGRLTEEMVPIQDATAVADPSSETLGVASLAKRDGLRWCLAIVAIVAFWWAQRRSRGISYLGLWGVLVVVIVFWPAAPTSDPPIEVLSGSPSAIGDRVIEPGPRVIQPDPDRSTALLRERDLAETWRSQSVRYEPSRATSSSFELRPRVVRIGESVTVLSRSGIRGSAFWRAPDGREIPEDPNTSSFQPDEPGVWSRIHGDEEAGVWVRPALTVTRVGPPEVSTSLFDEDDPRWNVRSLVVDGEPRLPQPASDGLLVWTEADEDTRYGENFWRQLSEWLESGGTLLLSGSPGFESSEVHESLSKLSGVELPRPPRNESPIYGVVLLDLSGSLAGAPMASLIRGVESLLASTPVGGRWGVAGFRDQAAWIVPPGSEVDASLMERVLSFQARGGTRLDRAIDFLETEWKQTEDGRVLLILSDGRLGRGGAKSWTDYGRQLQSAGIRISIVGVGPAVDPEPTSEQEPLATLAAAAGGTFVRVKTATEAAALLTDATRDPERKPVDYDRYLAPAGRHPWLIDISGQLPAPARGVRMTLRDAIALLVDARGRVALSGRVAGLGRVLTWHGDWSDGTLPAGRPAQRIRDAIVKIATQALRSAPRAARGVHRRYDVDGRAWLVSRRLPGEPPVIPVSWRGRDRSAWQAWGQEYRLPLPDEEGLAWVIEERTGDSSSSLAPPEIWVEGPAPVGGRAVGARQVRVRSYETWGWILLLFLTLIPRWGFGVKGWPSRQR